MKYHSLQIEGDDIPGRGCIRFYITRWSAYLKESERVVKYDYYVDKERLSLLGPIYLREVGKGVAVNLKSQLEFSYLHPMSTYNSAKLRSVISNFFEQRQYLELVA